MNALAITMANPEIYAVKQMVVSANHVAFPPLPCFIVPSSFLQRVPDCHSYDTPRLIFLCGVRNPRRRVSYGWQSETLFGGGKDMSKQIVNLTVVIFFILVIVGGVGFGAAGSGALAASGPGFCSTQNRVADSECADALMCGASDFNCEVPSSASAVSPEA